MFTFNGIGTTLYGKKDLDAEGWYTATKFFCVLFVPVIPLACYRVKRLASTGLLGFGSTQYEMYPIDADIKQARNIYLAAYIPLAIVFVLANFSKG